TFIGGFLLAALGGVGTWLYFTNPDLPKRTFSVSGVTLSPLESGQILWYYFAGVSVLAAAVGLFGMFSALAANRKAVKAFEALYFLALMTQVAFVIWAMTWCRKNKSNFLTVCNASKDGLFDLPAPGFVSGWSCDNMFLALMLSLGFGNAIWLIFHIYMTNRVIHYARELFAEKANRYKVLGEAAVKELDREQQIPLNYTNIGGSSNDREPPQPSYSDEIEYKNPRSDDYHQQSRAAAAGFGSYGHDLPSHQQQFHQGYQPYTHQPAAPGFSHRDSTQGLDLVNPYYDDGTIPAPPPPPVASSAPFVTVPGVGQSFVHGSTNKIPSPFDDDVPVTTPPAPATAQSPSQDIKVPMPPSPRDEDVKSPSYPPVDLLSPTLATQQASGSGSNNNGKSGEPYQF
ncbi:hypothetical protein BX616_006188, partial [Lobosporangium transversale]